MKQFAPLLFLFFFAWPLLAQEYITSVTRYDQEDGLSHNQVNWVYKDSRGMMWVGAANGINRYDGKEFKLVAPMDFHRVTHQYIIEDHEGDLWLRSRQNTTINDQSLVFFNTKTEKVKSFEEKFNGQVPLTNQELEKAIALSDGTTILGTDNGKLIFCDTSFQCDVKLKFEDSTVKVYKKHDTDNLWIYVRKIKPVDDNRAKGWKAEIYYIDTTGKMHDPIPFLSSAYNPIAVSNENTLLYEYDNQILEINPDGQIDTVSYTSSFNKLHSGLIGDKMTYDPVNDRFWFNYSRQLLAFDRGGGRLPFSSEIYKEFDATEYFNGFIDGDYYWLGSIDGLLKIHLKKTAFKKVFYKSPLSTVQGEFNSIRGIDEDEEGNIYVGTRIGLFNLKDLEQSINKINSANYSILYDDRGYIWVGYTVSIYRIDLKNKTYIRYPIPSTHGVYEETWSMYLDKNNRLWLGMGESSRMCYLDDGTDAIQVYGDSVRLDRTQSYVYDFFEDRDQQLWLVRNNGLFEFDIEKGIGERYWTGGDTAHFLPSNRLRHAYQDKDGVYWIASHDGLIRWDKTKNTHRLFTTEDGLSHNQLYAVYEDDFGFLWMSSDNGIIQFRKKDYQVRNYLPSDGISHREFNRISHFQGRDGKIYFGGMNGLTYFDPKDFVDDFEKQPDIPLVLTDCHVHAGERNQQESRLDDFRKNGAIIMAPGDRYLKFDFALLDYENSEHIQYVYNIDGQEDWSIGREASVNIGSLPYGEHTLTIKGKTASGLFSKQILDVPIIVLKPFYLQTWFLLLSALGLGGILFFIQKLKTKALLQRQRELETTVRQRTQTIQSQAEKLLQIDQTKSRFLANISHEFRTPLTLLLNTLDEENIDWSGQSKDIAEGRFFAQREVAMMQRNTRRLETLIEQLLDLSKLETGKMNLKASQGNFYLYLKGLVNTFQPLADKKELDLRFYTNEFEADLYFDRDKMDKIMYNLLYNAIKFTPTGGRITVDLQKNKNDLIVNVKDTGIGIPSAELEHIFDRFYQVKQKDVYAYEGTGLGLSLVREFVEMHGGEIKVASVLNEGTCFQLSFLPGYAHLKSEEIFYGTDQPFSTDKKIKEQVTDQTADELVTSEKVANSRPILLIIEDNADLRYYQQKQFGENYLVLLAQDGKQGLEMAFEQIPDVIICDIMMPGLSGYEVCESLKSDERTSHVPIVLLTAKATQEAKIQGLRLGADDYITKPYDRKELDLKIRNLLEQNQKLREQYQAQSRKGVVTSVQEIQDPFLRKITQLLETQLSNHNFGVEQLSEAANLSRSQLFRKIKAITDDTPTNFIRSFRLEKARQLMLSGEATPSEAAYAVGFATANYFFKCFKKEYGLRPSEMVELEKEKGLRS